MTEAVAIEGWHDWIAGQEAEPRPTHRVRLRISVDVGVVLQPGTSAYDGLAAAVGAAKRMDLPIPADRRERNVFTAQKRRHSEKPPSFYDMVERVSPGPYVDLFSRSPRMGWDSWGKGYETRAS